MLRCDCSEGLDRMNQHFSKNACRCWFTHSGETQIYLLSNLSSVGSRHCFVPEARGVPKAQIKSEQGLLRCVQILALFSESLSVYQNIEDVLNKDKVWNNLNKRGDEPPGCPLSQQFAGTGKWKRIVLNIESVSLSAWKRIAMHRRNRWQVNRVCRIQRTCRCH